MLGLCSLILPFLFLTSACPYPEWDCLSSLSSLSQGTRFNFDVVLHSGTPSGFDYQRLRTSTPAHNFSWIGDNQPHSGKKFWMPPQTTFIYWRNLLEANGWTSGNYSDPEVTLKLFWRQKPRDFWEYFSPGKDIVNRFPSYGHINDKAGNMKAIKSFFQGIGCNYEDLHPGSYSLRNYGDCLDFLEDVHELQESKPETLWYIKHPMGTGGKGIRVLPTSFLLSELKIASDNISFKATREVTCRKLKAARRADFLQKQIHPPLLIHESTFHVRIYLLVLSTDPYVVLFRKGFILRNLHPYQKYSPEQLERLFREEDRKTEGTKEGASNEEENRLEEEQGDKSRTLPLEGFITHTSFQEKHPNYSYTDHFWLFDKVEEYLGEEKMEVFLQSLKRMATTMSDVIEPANPKQKGLYFFLAVDSVVKEDMSVRMLEMNTVPYFGIESEVWEGRQREDFKIANEVLHLVYKFWGLNERTGLVLSDDWELLRDGEKRFLPVHSCEPSLSSEL